MKLPVVTMRLLAEERAGRLCKPRWKRQRVGAEHVLDDLVRLLGVEATERQGGFELAGRSMEEVERALIAANLALMGGNREKTAKVLGMGERTLYRKIKQYGL